MQKILYAGWLVWAAISSQFSVEMCVALKIAKKITKTPYFENSKLFKIINVDKSKKPVTSACYDKQPVYTYRQQFSHQTAK